MEQLPENSVSVDISIKVINTMVKYIYYGVRDIKKYQRLIDKIKSIRSFGNNGSRRLKYVLSELILNSEGLIGSFKPSNNNKASAITRAPNTYSVLKNKEFLINSLDIKKPEKVHTTKQYNDKYKNTWNDLESSGDEEEPAVIEPAASEPAASEPSASEPAASEPSASEPSASEPSASEPSASEPNASEPNASESKDC